MTPPDLTSFKPKDIFGALEFAKYFAAKDELGGIGEKEIYDTIRFYTMSIRDYLDEYFESDITKAHLSVAAIIGTALGPCSPGSAYVLLHHYMGEVDGSIGSWGYARGGMGAISNALAGAFQDHDGEIKKESEVSQIIVKNGRAKGVVLANGDEYYAKNVVSNLDVKRTYQKLFDPKDLSKKILKQVDNFKIRGSSGKLNIALDGLPEFPAMGKKNPLIYADMHFIDSLERMERAFDDWKNGRWSRDPYTDVLIPTMTDPTMSPPGKHYMSVFVQYAPAKLSTGAWTDKDRHIMFSRRRHCRIRHRRNKHICIRVSRPASVFPVVECSFHPFQRINKMHIGINQGIFLTHGRKFWQTIEGNIQFS
jgi:phytoene dehydrogenase-like protein